jgi:hypothetical protein
MLPSRNRNFSDAAETAFSNSKFIEDDRSAAAIVLSQKKNFFFHFKTTWPKFSNKTCSQIAHPGNSRSSSTISDQSQIFVNNIHYAQ